MSEQFQGDQLFPKCCPSVRSNLLIFGCFPRVVTRRLNLTFGRIYDYLVALWLVVIGWCLLFAFTGENALPPSGGVFVLYSLILLAALAGWVGGKMYVPPTLSQMLVGMCYRNLGLYLPGKTITHDMIVFSRAAAITFVTLRAGLYADARILKQRGNLILRIAILPMLAEMISVTVSTYYLLGFPWLWSSLLGSIISGASPAVAVHFILQLHEEKYGVDKDMRTIIITAVSFDTIGAMTVIITLLTIIYSKDTLAKIVLITAPIQIAAGVIIGVVYGAFLTFFPHQNYEHVDVYRLLFLGGGATSLVVGSAYFNYNGAGLLACIICSFIAATAWKGMGWEESPTPGQVLADFLFLCFQPIIFGMIGGDYDIYALDQRTTSIAVGILAIGMISRVVVLLLVAYGGNLNIKEKIFIAIVWMPKATVQACFGPVIMDRSINGKENLQTLEIAATILSISAMSILLFGSLGTLAMTVTGRHLLKKNETLESVPISSLHENNK